MMSLPYRQIHLDFHTAEAITDVGKDFAPNEFVSVLEEASVNSITLFAKCVHGWSYYPTRIGTPHPQLVRPDLLGEMVSACREAGIAVCIYLPVQWDELTARQHPEWRVIRAQRPPGEGAELDQLAPKWHPLSLANDALVEQIISQTCEVVSRYNPDGIFMDVLMTYDDVSQAALDRVRAAGLDPNRQEDRLRSARASILGYCERFHAAVRALKPDLRIFHNNGHVSRNERDRWRFVTHFELESLPTGGWGYDHFPTSAAYVSQLGREYLGMTGKFHTTWGEFGGYKRTVALEYECALMVAMGARCSIGDQLHPSGRMDIETYRLIAPAYRRVQKLEPYLENTEPVVEIAIFSAEGHHRTREHEDSDFGASRMLLELQIPFVIIDEHSDFRAFRLIILPDVITLEDELADRFRDFLVRGGSLIMSGSSGMSPSEREFVLPLAASVCGSNDHAPDFLAVEKGFDPDIVESPFVTYENSYQISSDGAEILGRIHDPYFNRTWDHFCSHQHAPAKPEPSPGKHGILRDGSIVYFAHPLFRMYQAAGQPLYKYLCRGAVRALLPRRQVEVQMPSSGRVMLRRQDDFRRLILHVIFAQLQLRGASMRGEQWQRPVEILEDAVPLRDVPCVLALDTPPSRVFEALSEKDLPFDYSDGRLHFLLEEVDLQAVVVIETQHNS